MVDGSAMLPLLGQGLRFNCNPLSFFFALLTLWVWPWATLFSLPYLAHSESKPRFYCFWLLTLVGCLGCFFAADIFTLYLFFELMSFSSWVLVIHEEDFDSLRAGNTYLYLSLTAGLALLAAAFLLQSTTGSTAWLPEPGQSTPSEPVLTAIGVLLLAGFGVKAGLFPLHFWLPQAHPVAPAPASAILSGILLKVGAYGLLRSVSLLARWEFPLLPIFGRMLVALAAVTMLLGAIRALTQENTKRLLAFSSVSQLGFVILATGLAALLYPAHPLAWVAALYQALNHALAKSALFLAAGALMLVSGSLSLSAAAGIAVAYPGLVLGAGLAAAAMAGVPGLSGYVSKTLLHHVVVAAANLKGPGWKALEAVFFLAGAGTTAYYLKFLLPWVQRSHTGEYGSHQPRRLLLWLPVLILASGTLAAGTLPALLLCRLLLPAALTFTGAEGTQQLTHELANFHPWSWPDLQGAVITLTLGPILYLSYLRLQAQKKVRFVQQNSPQTAFIALSHSFCARLQRKAATALCTLRQKAERLADRTIPKPRTLNPLAALLRLIVAWSSKLAASEELLDAKLAASHIPAQPASPAAADPLFSLAGRLLLIFCRGAAILDAGINRGGAALAWATLFFFRYTARFDDALDNWNRRIAQVVYSFFRKLGHLEKAPDSPVAEAKVTEGWERFLRLDLLNLDVAVLLLALVLLLTLLYFLLQS